MAPTNIQGLNIVHPQIQADSHDLLSGQSYPDLSAQLDLWTNLTFESDEPLNSRASPDDKFSTKSLQDDDDDEAARSPVTTEKAVHDGHINVVTGITLANTQHHHDPAPRPHQAPVPPPFDVTSFLAGFGIDPFSIPAAQPQPHPISPSLAQLLAYHSAAAQAHHHVPTYAHPAMPQIPAPAAELPSASYLRNSTPAARPSSPSPSAASEEPPAAKRARTRKASVSAAASPEGDASTTGNTFSAAEDKRRRNTAASARFRLKKKEREAALESKAKELEQKVSDLERECEGLRRENGWLKGLVVGVTGAAQAPVVNPPASLMTPSSSSASSKRRRDEESA